MVRKSVCFCMMVFLISFYGIKTFAQKQELHFTPIWIDNPFQPMSHIITYATIDGVALKTGDEIGVFDTSGNDLICVGAAKITHEITPANPLIICSSCDDPGTPEKDGFTQGNEIFYMIYDSVMHREVENVQAESTAGYDTAFRALGTAVDSVWAETIFNRVWLTERSVEGVQLFPVPASEIINVRGKSCALFTKYQVFDMNNDLLMENYLRIPEYTLDISSLKNGIYTIRLIGNRTVNMKVIKMSPN